MIVIFNAAKKKQKEKFTELFSKYQNDVYRVAFVYMKNHEEALDIVQETAYRAYLKFNTLNELKYFKTWLIKIAVNCSIDLLRKKQKVNQMEIKEHHIPYIENNDVPLSVSLQDLLEVINSNERTILFLRYFEDYTFREISEFLNQPISTVKTIHYRALEKLRERVRKEDVYG